MKNDFYWVCFGDLLLIILVFIASSASIFIFPNAGIVRTILAFLILFLLPGYVLHEIIFFKIHSTVVDKLAMSIVFSLCLLVFTCLVLSWINIPLNVNPLFFSIALLVLLFSTLAMLIRWKHRKDGIRTSTFKEKYITFTRNSSRLDKVLLGMISLSLVLMFSIVVLNFSFKQGGEHYTEFSATSIDGQGKVTSNVTNRVAITVTNREQETRSYLLLLKRNGSEEKVKTGEVENGSSWSYIYTISSTPTSSQEFILELYINGSAEPYRRLKLLLSRD